MEEEHSHVDIVHLDNPEIDCSLPEDFPLIPYRYAASGGILGGNQIVMCGGNDKDWKARNECFSLYNPEIMLDMTGSRRYSSASILVRPEGSCQQEPVLWITGGANLDGNHQNFLHTTSLVSINQSIPGPDLPLPLMGHCLVKKTNLESDNEIVLIGGNHNGNSQQKIYIYNWIKEDWTTGPDMKSARQSMACGGLLDQFDGTWIIVAASGGANVPGRRTEILDTRGETASWHWQDGPELPVEKSSASGVASWDNKYFYVVGGSADAQDASTDIYRLKCFNMDCDWSQSNPQLYNPKSGAVAVLLPDSLVQAYCNLE